MRIWTTVMGQRLDDAADTRSMILCDHLLRRGHQVTMWTSAWDHIRKEWRKEWRAAGGAPVVRDDGLEIRFMKGSGYQRNTSPMRLVDHWGAAQDFTRQALASPRPDAIVASLPDHVTAAAAVSLGQKLGAATIVDVRDKWPDVIADFSTRSAAGQVARRLMHFEHRRTRRALAEADAVVAMMHSMLDWALAKAGRRASALEQVFYLTTAPKAFDVEPPALPEGHPVRAALAASEGRVRFAFAGTFNRTQHPELLLTALEQLKRENHPALRRAAFLIGGDGQDADQVRQRAAALDNVHCVGWMKPPEMRALLMGADVGLVLMNYPTEAFNNKSFSYMAAGLPIISGARGDLQQLIEAETVGLNVPGGDAGALAQAIVRLTEDDALRTQMRARMRRLFDARFDREKNYTAYADHVERVAGLKAPSRAAA
ncbi:glycosyltransferase family 4 protein [Caulobacter sp. KR2-114]|uniref:glycosyltransferase family 4 protein n=1 Tax=Caulobacter sp. KR2-114 TaxID=3400912 RepID=UPI003C05262F